VINGGTIRMNNTAATGNGRGFTIGRGGATLEANGGNNLWLHTGGTITNNANGSLTLTGSGLGQLDMVFSGTGALTKSGTGTWTLTNTNTYTGDTTILAGTLSLGTPSLSNNADVLITTGAVLNLNTDTTDTIRGLKLDGVAQPIGSYHSGNTPFITGAGELIVTEGPTQFEHWLATAGLTPGNPGTDPLESHDGSGVANLVQFALGGDLNVPTNNGTYAALDAGDGSMLLTIAVRQGAVFAGSPTPTATIDGITYAIEGAHNLHHWDAAVEEVVPAHTGGHIAPAGYQLKSFRINPPEDGGHASGFLRVKIDHQ
jgi:autotransporter-associated beta strand protein